ncbi:MAG: FAD-binding oxidoreductase, partial [Alphaproteobacteria bacterium]
MAPTLRCDGRRPLQVPIFPMDAEDRSYDVVIVGGAVMGCAVAYFLAGDPDFDGRILVVERDPGYGACATTRSWGGIRQQFSTPQNVRMSLFGATFAREAGALLAVDGQVPELAFREAGYLFLASAAGRATLAANVRLQCDLGADIALLDPPALAARFAWLNLDGVAAGALGLRNEGWIDPAALLHALRRKARALGVTFAHDTVSGFGRAGGRISAVHLLRGGSVACGAVVNAAGPQAGALARLAGLDL